MGTEAGDDTGGGAGGALDLLGGAGGGDQQEQQQGGEQPQGDGQQQQGEDQGGGAADPDWYATLSAEAGEGDAASHRDYVKGKGFKTPDDVVKAYRAAEKAIHDSGRVKVPGEGATAEEVAAWNKAIGVPDDVAGYAITPPNDAQGNPIELDDAMLGRMAESALKHGASKTVYEGIVGDFIQGQLDDAAAFDAAQQKAGAAVVKEWGADKAEKLAAVDRAAAALGMSSTDMIAIRNAIGADKALKTFAKLGEGMAEDVLISGGRGRFGVSGAEAAAEIETLKADPEFTAKLMKGDPQARARWNRLNDAVGEWEDAKAKAA